MRIIAIVIAGAAVCFSAWPAQSQYIQRTDMPPICRNLAWGTQEIAKCIALGGIEWPYRHHHWWRHPIK
jgi:hypothetical protein